MNDKKSLAAYLQQLRMQELQSNINSEVVIECLNVLRSPIQQVIDNYLKAHDGKQIDLYEMIVIALQEAERVVVSELTEADAVAVISRVIGNVVSLFDSIRESNCGICGMIPEEVLEAAAALKKGRKGLGSIVIIGGPGKIPKTIRDLIEGGD